MNINYIQSTRKLTDKKQNYLPNNIKKKEVKDAINILSNFRTNIYKRIYLLTKTPIKNWRSFDFLSDDNKIEAFVNKIEKEIKVLKNNDFDFYKYREIIACVLGKDVDKFNETIIKNMYIAKLQNIVFLLKEVNDDETIKEVKSKDKNLSR